jgi:hypothetical protein
MRKVGRPPKDKTPAIEDLPEHFRLAFIKVMAQFGIANLHEGYRRAAILLDRNSEQYQKDVEKEAERRYRSRHFKEMNSARMTIDQGGFDRGYPTGYREAEKTFKITYPCSVCGEILIMMPNANDHLAAQRYLREHNWAHSACHKK